ncbi:MAG: hypothetical protein QXW88_07690, partial [Thermofilum sp.]
GGATEELYYLALKHALDHPEIDSVLVLYCETKVADPLQTAEAILRALEDSEAEKPVVAGLLGGEGSRRAVKRLAERGVPAYPTPERAARALAALHRYAWLRSMLEKRRVQAQPQLALLHE